VLDGADERRHLSFEGAVNFRDVGGYQTSPGRTTRWHRLYRSDNLGALTGSDLRRIDDLGLRTLVDFRRDFERERHPNRLPNGNDIAIVRADFMPEGTIRMLGGLTAGQLSPEQLEVAMIDQYRRYVTDHHTEIRTLIDRLLDAESLPLLVHCTSGKDRTGFAIATILLAVGATPETALADYLLTNAYRRDIGHLFGPRTSAEAVDVVTGARPTYLAAAFEKMRERFGSIDGYLARGLSLTDDERARLADNLTESAPLNVGERFRS
jgi:protein-tyrosine phosphatase